MSASRKHNKSELDAEKQTLNYKYLWGSSFTKKKKSKRKKKEKKIEKEKEKITNKKKSITTLIICT